MRDDTSKKSECPWWVYIIRTGRQAFYIGIATDPVRRFQEHLDVFEGKPRARGAKFFRTVAPESLVYREGCGSRSEASKREWELKQLTAAEKRLLIARAKTL